MSVSPIDVSGSPPASPEDARDPTALACLCEVARHHGVHLAVDQLVHDNVLADRTVRVGELLEIAQRAGLRATRVRFAPDALPDLGKALPAIVRLRNGSSIVLQRVEGKGDAARYVLVDPATRTPLPVDRIRFADAATGEIILVKRDYAITDETRPFGFGLVAGLIFRERWIVRDVAICALVMAFLALTPIMFWRLLTDKVLYFGAYNTFVVLCIAFAALVAVDAVFSYLRNLLVVHLTTRVDVRLGTYIFDKLLNLPMDFFERTQVGKVTHDIYQLWKIRMFLMGQLFGTVLDSTTLLIFVPVMFFFSPVMTLVVLGMCALMVAWLVIMLPSHRRRSMEVEAAEAQRGAFLIQTIHGIRTVKSLALDARQRHTWDVHNAKVARLRFREGMSANLIQAVARPFERLAVTGSFAVGVWLALTTSDPVYIGALFAFLMLSQRVSGPLLQAARLINQYDDARIALGVVAQLVNQPAEEGRSEHGVRTPLVGAIQFARVTFRYEGAPDPALDSVSFEVPSGTTLGVMGRSGSGKTTITRLLQRLHSNYGGLIKIDGIDVREYDVDHLRRSIGVVLQENFLFSGSIRENIAAGRPDATFEDVVRAARLAGAEEFIDRLPRGYETHIYEGSPNLSGGQRQRLAIARALIVDPRILILDEATSALDAESEAIVNANIARIAEGRTLIIISHRLSALMHADSILVLDRGKATDIGTHEELLERSEIYSNLWHQQTSHIVAAERKKTPPRGPARVA
ncbi:MAG TPA: peptidase domain-containing ABC transporter [Bauldia sp.]|nr:peptidase domain-containing ABC transporter [Bauldia sp.]